MIRLRHHRLFLLVVVLFTVGAILQMSLLPALEGYDEMLHFNYVRVLRSTGGALPDRAESQRDVTWQESNQPPLTYYTAALLINLFGFGRDPGTPHAWDGIKNRWYTPPDLFNMRDNHNYFVHGRDEAIPLATEAYPVYAGRVARLASFLWGLFALVGVYLAALQVFSAPKWAVLAALLFALTPEMLHLSAVFSNDAPTAAFGAIITWQLLWLVKHRVSIPRLILLGLLIGAAGLVKVNTLLVLIPVAVALLCAGAAQKRPLLRIVLNGLLVGAIALLILSPWMIYGWQANRSPLGLEVHSIFQNDGKPVNGLGEYLAALVPVFGSYWGRFGAGSVWLPASIYTLYAALCALAIAGAVLGRRYITRDPLRLRQAAVLVSMCTAFAAGLMYWLYQLSSIRDGIQGRLAYTAHAAVCIVLTGGVALLMKQFPRIRRLVMGAFVTIPLYSGLLIAPLTLIAAFSVPPPAMNLPPLSGPSLTYGGSIRLLGTQIEQPKLSVGSSLITLNMCWQVIQPPADTREAVLAIKLLTAEGASVGDRTTLLGLGRYPVAVWEAGYRFCDKVDVILRGPFDVGSVYDVAAYILDWSIKDEAGNAVEVPRVGQVVNPAGIMSLPDNLIALQADFKGLANLRGYTRTGEPKAGAALSLALWWNVAKAENDDLARFVHLYGPDNFAAVLADGTPRNGQYPASVWSAGEQFSDSLAVTLPGALKPGHYRVVTGLYYRATGERIFVSQNGQATPDRTVELFSFDMN